MNKRDFLRSVGGASIGMLVGGPIALYALTVRDPVLFTRLFGVGFFFLTWYNGPLSAVIFDVVPSRISATAMGAYLMPTAEYQAVI